MLSVLAIVISLVLLIYLGYKGWSIVLLAPILALLAAVLTAIVTGGQFHILPAWCYFRYCNGSVWFSYGDRRFYLR